MWKSFSQFFYSLAGIFLVSFVVSASNLPITIVVPYSAGGTNDTFARLLAEGMSKELKRPVIVENRPGANGVIGASFVARAKPDGTTLFLGGTGPISLNILLRPTLSYGFDDFSSVAMLFDGPLTVTVPTALGVNSLQELKSYAQSQRADLLYGTMGPGSVSDLYGLLLAKTLGVPMTAVAYKDNHSALLDLMSSRGDINFATPIPMLTDAKELTILALSTRERDLRHPDIPTVLELGYPELETSYWTALLAPKGTPSTLIEAISKAAIKSMATTEFNRLLDTSGQNSKAGGPEMLDAQLAWDREHWGSVIRENNIVLQ